MSKQQKINVELYQKSKNKYIKNVLNKLLPSAYKRTENIEFNCECSDPKCNKKVSLKLNEYDKYNKVKKLFVLAKGHVTPSLEKAVINKKDYTVVEKFSL